MNVLRSQLESARSYAGSVSWGPLVQLSRAVILSVLSKVEKGSISITDCNGQEVRFGKETESELSSSSKDTQGRTYPSIHLEIHREAFWVRMLLFADLGFAESFMLGDFSCDDLTSFFEIFIINRHSLSNGTTLTSTLSSYASSLLRRTNSLANSRLNIAAHYDISNDMFAAFLSPDMTYSCPIWSPTTSPKHKSETLEQAQYNKLQYFIDNAHLKSSDHVLEIGTGWGSFAIEAVRQTGCTVTSLTLSSEQKSLAEERIAEAGLTDNIEVLLCDYRALPIPKSGLYDKVVSIEMLEAVGHDYLKIYFECVSKLLKPDGGIAVFQCITMPENRYEAYNASTDFIREYIFPGGHLPSVSLLLSSIAAGSKNTLIPHHVLDIGPHYARTLRCWRENFSSNFEAKIKPALLREHRGMTESDVELFRRKWEYYYMYCEAGFRTCTLGDVIVTVAREGATEMAEGVPL